MSNLNRAEPPLDCALCPRLVSFREDNQTAQPTWHNAPVLSFGSPDAELLIVGLAPGLKGANQTGRPFTGDYAGDLLYATLSKFEFALGTYDSRPDDGYTLKNCLITNAVRCVPPQNKPTAQEINACRPFLQARLATLPNLKAVLALGRIAHESFIRTMSERQVDHKFGHEAVHELSDNGRPLWLIDSYHCSRYNTNTGRLTEEMFESVFIKIRTFLERK